MPYQTAYVIYLTPSHHVGTSSHIIIRKVRQSSPTYFGKPGMVMHICNPSTQEGEGEGS
jgi:hypothetical protein